jgi:hypothetical protein
MKFHQAISLGDINNDGIDDVAVRINQGTLNRLRIYYGNNSAVGVNATAPNYQDFSVQGDSSAGLRMVPAGKTTPTQFSTFWITGTNASYLFFSGISGLIQGVPSAFSLGGTPRKFYAPSTYTGTIPALSYYLDFGNARYYNPENTGNIDTSLNTLTPFAHGDFNLPSPFLIPMVLTSIASSTIKVSANVQQGADQTRSIIAVIRRP